MSTVLVTAADVSLMHVAAAQLGDATQWWRIAQANSLTGPDLTWLSGPVPLVIPSVDPSFTTGLPVLEA